MRWLNAKISGVPQGPYRHIVRWSGALAVAAVLVVTQPSAQETDQPTDPPPVCVTTCQESALIACTVLGECPGTGEITSGCRACIATFLGECVATCMRNRRPQ